MDNGHDEKLASKMTGLVLNDSASSSSNLNSNHVHGANGCSSPAANISDNNDSLIQVMKAVEAAEATIRQQVEENTLLRNELQRKIQELEKYKMAGSTAKRSHPVDQHAHSPHDVQQSIPSIGDLDDKIKNMSTVPRVNPLDMLVLHQKIKNIDEDSSIRSGTESLLNSRKINGRMMAVPGGKEPTEYTGLSQLSSPSAQSISTGRYQMDREYDLKINSARHELMQMDEVKDSSALWKQDLALKIRDNEEEILQLKKHLSDYSLKEAQIRNEKYVLEKRIAYMRLAFDQQQQDLVDAASKALSYRQDIIEENIRLTYELQAAQQERTTFVSSLLPLLAEYSLQPPVPDAQSIVSNVRVLFKHLQEKLLQTESKLKEFQYQLAPWRSDVNHSSAVSHSRDSPSNPASATPNKNGLDLVPQPDYNGNIPMASPDAQTPRWDTLSHHQRGLGGGAAENMKADDRGRYSPLASSEETTNRQVTFHEPVSDNETDDPEAEEQQSESEFSDNQGTTKIDEPSTSYSPHLPPVLEEPSSFSEAADDDPLPAIEGLQISGEAFPGRELQATGYSINGTTSCNFEWVRHLEDGSVDYIEGAKQPNYLVTADDVNTYLAIEVQPLDDRKRKGELVKVFANEHRKIFCDPEMQNHIERNLYDGHASYRVSIPTKYEGIWEPATLAIKREGYSIKCNGSSSFLVNEKFSSGTTVAIPYGKATEFIIISSNGEHLLQADDSLDSSSARDTIALTLRLFILRVGEKKKKKKKSLFFHK